MTQRRRNKPNLKTTWYRPIANMTLGQAAYGAMRGVNMMRGIVNSEKKRFDFALSFTPSNIGSIQNLSLITAGDDANNRQGNSILAKYMTFQYIIRQAATAIATDIRILIITDTQNQGVDPTLAQILQFTIANTNITSPINIDNTQRFTVLMDHRHSISNTGAKSLTRKYYKSLNFHMRFTGVLSSDYNKNAIYLVLISNEGAGATAPTFEGSSRIVFYDN